MGGRDGRGVAGRVTLRRLRGNHHPPNAGVVFYHLQGKAGKGVHAMQHLNRTQFANSTGRGLFSC